MDANLVDVRTSGDSLSKVRHAAEGLNPHYTRARGSNSRFIAIVHLLCANCLEATINAIGKDLLNGSMFEEFDKLSLTGKWLFLPKIQELEGFDPGEEPFQSFNRMVRFRNSLTHYRPKKESGPAFAVPTFLGSLGLTVQDAERSVKVTREMVGDIHKQLNRKMDYGWDAERWTYFGLKFDSDKT
jgi:hypothetical protein